MNDLIIEIEELHVATTPDSTPVAVTFPTDFQATTAITPVQVAPTTPTVPPWPATVHTVKPGDVISMGGIQFVVAPGQQAGQPEQPIEQRGLRPVQADRPARQNKQQRRQNRQRDHRQERRDPTPQTPRLNEAGLPLGDNGLPIHPLTPETRAKLEEVNARIKARVAHGTVVFSTAASSTSPMEHLELEATRQRDISMGMMIYRQTLGHGPMEIVDLQLPGKDDKSFTKREAVFECNRQRYYYGKIEIMIDPFKKSFRNFDLRGRVLNNWTELEHLTIHGSMTQLEELTLFTGAFAGMKRTLEMQNAPAQHRPRRGANIQQIPADALNAVKEELNLVPS